MSENKLSKAIELDALLNSQKHLKQSNSYENDSYISAFQLEHQRELSSYAKIAKLAPYFDYDKLVPEHINGLKYLNNVLQQNFMESCILDSNPTSEQAKKYMAQRFRGYYPVVIDVETTGLFPEKNGIMQIAAVALTFDQDLQLVPYAELRISLLPEKEDEFMAESLMITGINPFDYKRKAVRKSDALKALCKFVRQAQKQHGCKRSVIVAHNAGFDAAFLHHHIEKCNIKRNPFHPFTNFDTGVLGAVFLGDSRLKEALSKININYNFDQAHDALYDAQLCAKLFCYCVNSASKLNRFPIS